MKIKNLNIKDSNIRVATPEIGHEYEAEAEKFNPHVLDEKNGNKFMKVLIACGITLEQMRDYAWTVEQIGPWAYTVDGVHPSAARIRITKPVIVIH